MKKVIKIGADRWLVDDKSYLCSGGRKISVRYFWIENYILFRGTRYILTVE